MSFDVRQAEDHIAGRKVTRIAIASGVVFIGSIAAAAVLLGIFSTTSAAPNAAPPPNATVERSLIQTTRRGADERAHARESLSQWQWVDRDAGIASIPIDRAIDLVVAGDGGAP